MLQNLFAAKLEPPLLPPSQVPREHLVQKLNWGFEQGHKLFILSAPEGFGKTTLVANWLAQSGNAHTWLTLTEDDNDPMLFLMYLTAALQKVHPEIGAGLQGAWLMREPNPDRLMLTLVNDVTKQQQKFILVLDDYHRINSSIIHRLVGILLDHSPTTLRIVITGSSEPPLPLAAWRASHQLTELRALDLRFSLAETQALAHQMVGASLSPEEAQAIQDCSSGWPAGALLACWLLRRSGEQSSAGYDCPDPVNFPKTLPVSDARPGEVDDEAASVLLQAVFDQHPEDARDALLRASVLRWGVDHTQMGFFHPVLHDRLFAHSYAGWARLHPYWRSFLTSRLLAAFPRAMLAELHAAASQFFESRGFIDEAIFHALAGPDDERAAELVKHEIEHAFWRQGSALHLRLYLSRIPKPVLAAHPELALQFSQALFFLEDFQGAEVCLQLAREGNEAGEAENGLRTELAAMQACLLRVRGELDLFLELALHMLDRRSDLTPLSTTLLLFNLGLALIQRDDLPAAREQFEAAYRQARAAENVLMALAAQLRLAQVEFMSGRLQEAENVCLSGLKLCAAVGEAVNLYAGLLSVYLGDVYYEWNRLQEAARFYQIGAKTGARTGSRLLFSLACSGMVQLLIVRGETDRTEIWMRAVRELVQPSNSSEDQALTALVARLELRRGKLEAAARWARNFRLYPGSTCTYDEMVENETWIQVQVALGRRLQDTARLRQALAIVRRLLPRAEDVGWLLVVLRLYILQALIHQSLGDCPEAVNSLSHAMKLAAAAGFVRTIIDEGQPVFDLLGEACLQDGPRAYFQKLFDALPTPSSAAGSLAESRPPDSQQSRQRKAPVSASAVQVLEKGNLHSLTSREQDVLALLASGHSYEETAGKLVITVNTVRTHIKSIYRKLGVSSRGRAVQEASRLGILTC